MLLLHCLIIWQIWPLVHSKWLFLQYTYFLVVLEAYVEIIPFMHLFLACNMYVTTLLCRYAFYIENFFLLHIYVNEFKEHLFEMFMLCFLIFCRKNDKPF